MPNSTANHPTTPDGELKISKTWIDGRKKTNEELQKKWAFECLIRIILSILGKAVVISTVVVHVALGTSSCETTVDIVDVSQGDANLNMNIFLFF